MIQARQPSRDVHLDNLGDLRRRARADVAERVLARAVHLPERDRALLEALYRDGKSAKDLARLTRLPARTLRLRVRRLVQRVTSPTFALVLIDAANWPILRQRIAALHIVEGKSVRTTAHALRISLHHVRAHLAWIGMQIESRDPSTSVTRASTKEPRP